MRFVAMQARFLLEKSMACGRGITVIFAIVAAMVAAAPVKGQAADGPDGIWLTQAGDAKVRVSKCGGGICGVVVR